MDTLGTSAPATKTKRRKKRGVDVEAIPPTEHAPTGGGGHLGEGGRDAGGLPISVAESCAASWAAQVDPQQQQGSCSGAASTAEVNPLRGPMPSEQGGSGSVLPESDLGDLGETWRQLPYEQMLHLYSGQPRLGSLAHAAEQLRVITDQVDLMQGGSECNMALHESREAILAAVRAIQYSIVWIGTPCSSFSLWWLDKSMRQLRSRERPMGVDGLPQRERAYLRKHNVLVEFSAKVALAAYEAGVTFIIENPLDRGRPSSHLLAKRWSTI